MRFRDRAFELCVLPLLVVGACVPSWRQLPATPAHATRSVIDERGRSIAVRLPTRLQAVFMGIGLGPYLMVTRQPAAIVSSRSPENRRIVESSYLARCFVGLGQLRMPLAQAETGTFNRETMLAQHPDVVVTWARLAEPFERIGLPTVGALPIDSTERLEATTRLYADVVDDAVRGTAIVARSRALRADIAAVVAARTSARPRLLFLLPLAAGRWNVAAGFPDIVAEAGARDVGVSLPRNAMLDAERLIALAPDVIVVVGGPAASVVTPTRLMNDPALATLPAIKGRRVYAAPPGVSGHMMTTMELPIETSWLAGVLHPDARLVDARAVASKVYSTELGVPPSAAEIDRDLATPANSRSRGGDQ